MRARAAQAGVIIVDCGVTCPPGGHAHKRIVGMVGADPAIYDRIRPVLADFTQAAPRMGGPGAGMATKIVRNMMFYTTWLAAAEASRLAAQADIDIEQMAVINALSEADASGPTMWLQSAASRDAVPGGATARFEHVRDVMLKDLNAAARLAGEYDVELPLIELMREKADAIVSPWR